MSWEITELIGYFTSASNAAFLARCDDDRLVVYKPVAGERPLWDFPTGSLAIREYLTFRVDAALGFDNVPETALGDGPHGPGVLQRYIEADHDYDVVSLIERADPTLWPVAVLDVLANNADRKVGHLLWEPGSGRIRSIDHGLTFHADEKLRTVLWGFAGLALPDPLVAAVVRLQAALTGDLGAEIGDRLDGESLAVLRRRVEDLLERPVHPLPPDDRPAMPWPPF